MAVSNAAAGSAADSAEMSTGDGPALLGPAQAVRSLSFAAPLHPILVHYAIALTSVSLLFDLLSRVFHVASLASAGWWALALAVIATMGALVSGVASRVGLDIGEGEARSYLRLHMALGPIFFGMLVGTAAWRAHLWLGTLEVGWWYLAALAATSGVMFVQGYAGGELVYRWGAHVEGLHRDLRQQGAVERAPRLKSASVEAAGRGRADRA